MNAPRKKLASARLAELRQAVPPSGVTGTMSGRTLMVSMRGAIGEGVQVGAPVITARAFDALLEIFVKAKSIDIDINSPGGLVAESEAIVDRLKASGLDVTTRAGRQCSSAAIDILLAGNLRIAASDSHILLHAISLAPDAVPGRWTAERHARVLASLRRHDDRLVAALIGRCGGTDAEWRKEIATETPISPIKAQIRGLVHLVEGRSRQHGRALARDFGIMDDYETPRGGKP